MSVITCLQSDLVVVFAVFYFCDYFHNVILCHCEEAFAADEAIPDSTGDCFALIGARNDMPALMIKNQRFHTQRNDASIHERCPDVNVIAFGQADLVNDEQCA